MRHGLGAEGFVAFAAYFRAGIADCSALARAVRSGVDAPPDSQPAVTDIHGWVASLGAVGPFLLLGATEDKAEYQEGGVGCVWHGHDDC